MGVLVATGCAFVFFGFAELRIFGAALWVLALPGLIDGTTEIDIPRREIRRTVRLFSLIPIFQRRQKLGSGASVHLTFTPGWTDRHGNSQRLEFTTVELRTPDGKRIELAQAPGTSGELDAGVVSDADAIAKALGAGLQRETRRPPGAVHYTDGTTAPHAPALEARTWQEKRRTFAKVIVGVNVVLLLFLAFDMVANARILDAFKPFRTVTGRVVDVRIAEHAERSANGVQGKRHQGYVRYRYEVDGRKRESERLLLFDHPTHAGFEAGARRSNHILGSYSIGQSVPVHVARDDPDVAYLETGWYVLGRMAAGMLPGWAITMGVMGGFWFVMHANHQMHARRRKA